MPRFTVNLIVKGLICVLPETCATPSQPETARAPDVVAALPYGHSLLQGQYRIERELMAGGFGITYLARDSLDRRMVIKECFPAGFCARDGAKVTTHSPYRAKSFKNVLRHFLREAQWLARAQHDNIVTVHQVFKENGTAYIAMDYIDGCDLVSLRQERASRLDQQFLSHILDQALRAISVLHARGILHRDISPDNFIVDAQDTLTLIDFGAASGSDGEADTALGAMLSVKDGYSPHEFYQPDTPQRFSSDLYALGASFHFLVTGVPPVHAQERLKAVTAGYEDPCPLLEEGNWPYAPEFLRSIDKAMSILPGMRFQSADEWIDSLPDPVSAPADPALQTLAQADADPPPAAADIPEAVISDLVAATNKDLTPGQLRAGPVSAQPLDISPKPKQLVDIFGEPISDVDHWLEVQDQVARGRSTTGETSPQLARPAPDRSAPPQAPTDTIKTENKAGKPAQATGWVKRMARVLGSDSRLGVVAMNGKTK